MNIFEMLNEAKKSEIVLDKFLMANNIFKKLEDGLINIRQARSSIEMWKNAVQELFDARIDW